jgi:hypothetical protein
MKKNENREKSQGRINLSRAAYVMMTCNFFMSAGSIFRKALKNSKLEFVFERVRRKIFKKIK